MTAVGHRHDSVTIADRRELPFFMVHTRAVEAIREHTAGPRRVRTIGFYGLLCQLANEQRNIGQQRCVRYSYDLLAARGGVSKGNIAKILTGLEQAGVLRRETQPGPERGGSISIAHLLIHEHSFIAVTVPMADRLAAPRDGGICCEISGPGIQTALWLPATISALAAAVAFTIARVGPELLR